MLAITFALAVQQWTAAPQSPTVGDTIWLERALSAPPGWVVRPARFPRGANVEPLGDPVVRQDGQSWLVKYPIVAWEPGTLQVALPTIWRVGPGGEADSLTGGVARLAVSSVLPDTGTPAPRAALPPLPVAHRRARWPILTVTLAALALWGAVAWRRRGPRPIRAAPHVPLEVDVGDDRWLTAGEPRAVAARAAAALRWALVQRVPAAHPGLSTAECVAACEGRLRADQVAQLAEVLHALDRVAFASAHGADVADLARRARGLL